MMAWGRTLCGVGVLRALKLGCSTSGAIVAGVVAGKLHSTLTNSLMRMTGSCGGVIRESVGLSKKQWKWQVPVALRSATLTPRVLWSVIAANFFYWTTNPHAIVGVPTLLDADTAKVIVMCMLALQTVRSMPLAPTP